MPNMKVSNIFANDTNNRSVGRHVTQIQEALMVAFSPYDCAYFAMTILAVDGHRLRVFDTDTGALKCDYRAENEEKFSSLSWGFISSQVCQNMISSEHTASK
jgi:hypothetical protein